MAVHLRSAALSLRGCLSCSLPALLPRHVPTPTAIRHQSSPPRFPSAIPTSSTPTAPLSPPLIVPDSLKRDPVASLLVNTIMKAGKKAQASRLVSDALRLLQQRTGENPLDILARAVDAVAPVVKLQVSRRGATRTATPWPLGERARRRQAILWIREAADKKRAVFPVRFANEVLAVNAGTSPALEKKANVHRLALQNRSNVVMRARVLGRSS